MYTKFAFALLFKNLLDVLIILALFSVNLYYILVNVLNL